MKFLIINYEFPPIGGGNGDVSYNLAKELVQKSHEVKILTVGFRGLAQQETREGFEVIRLGYLRKRPDATTPWELFLFVVFGVFPALRIVKRFRPDLIHGHSLLPAGSLCFIARLVWRVPYAITLQGGDAPGAVSSATKVVNFLQKILLPFSRIILSKANLITVASGYLGELFQKNFPEIHTVLIPNGVDTNLFVPRPYYNRNPSVVFAYCGRLSQEKGILTLYEATKLLYQRFHGKFLVKLIGDGPLRKKLEEVVETDSLQKIFEITGWVSKEKVHSFLQQVDVFIMPSYYETLPNTASLQALSCGLSFVCSDLPDSEDLARDEINGFRFKTGDPHALAEKMERFLFLSEEDLKQMSEESRKIALAYSWKKIVTRYLKEFELSLNE